MLLSREDHRTKMVSLLLQFMIPNLECTSRVNPNVNLGLQVIMMRQCGLISCNKGTALVWNANDGGDYACVRVEGLCKSLYLINFA